MSLRISWRSFRISAFAGAAAEITPKLHTIFSELAVVLVQLAPAVAYFSARAMHVFEILPYLRFVVMAAIVIATISMIEARIGTMVIVPVVLVEFFSWTLLPTLVLAIIFVTLEMFVFLRQRGHCGDGQSGAQ